MSQISGNVLLLSEAREPPMTSSSSHYYWRLPHYTRSKTSIVIIGTGPRGIAVLEVIATKLLQDANGPPVRILLVDSSELGAGRIWRTDQEPWFLMNTVIGEISMFSGADDGGTCRPGAGCTFLQWLHRQDDPELSRLGHDDYAPRFAYGRYLKHVYKSILRNLEGRAEVTEILGQVTAIHLVGSRRYRVAGSGSRDIFSFDTDAAVLTTGHSRTELPPDQGRLAAIAARQPGLRYISGDSAADLDLDNIPSQSSVGIIGLGLSFYDILMSFTVGRGGQFKQTVAGMFSYIPSGREPNLVAGSRAGLPILSRGRNQKTVRSRSRPRFLTTAAVASLREKAHLHHGSPSLDFDRDLLPLLHAEVNYVYYTTQAAAQYGAARARALGAELTAIDAHPDRWREIAVRNGLNDSNPLDLNQLSRPFVSVNFDGPDEFTSALRDALLLDISEAEQGNVGGPLKAALDTIRDLRDVLRYAVDFGGLTPDSHRDEFLGQFVSTVSLLFTGPPVRRTAQLLALVEANILNIVGPDAVFDFDPVRGEFFVESPPVAASRRHVSTILDSRIPSAHLLKNTDPLMRQLVADGMVSGFVNRSDVSSFDTGALRVTSAEHRIISPDGTPHRALYALGIPTEGIRWFTQIGNGRPGVRTSFLRDAEAIALSIIRRTGSAARSW